MPKPNLWVGSRTQSDSGATTAAIAVVERLSVKPRLRRSYGDGHLQRTAEPICAFAHSWTEVLASPQDKA